MARAAGTFRWRGNGAGTKSSWNDGRNWVDASGTTWANDQWPGYDGAAESNVDGDIVLFDAPLETGALSPAGFDLTSYGDLGDFKVTDDYNGTIGSSEAPLKLDSTATAVQYLEAESAGDIYLHGVGTRGARQITLTGKSPSGTVYLGGVIGNLSVLRGRLSIESTAVIATMFVTFIAGRATDSQVTIAMGAALPASIDQSGGTVICSTEVSTLRIAGGSWTQLTGKIATVVIAGGTLVWNGGDITTAYLQGGTIDASASETSRTMTACYLSTDGKLRLNNGVGTARVTTLVCLCTRPQITITPRTSISL